MRSIRWYLMGRQSRCDRYERQRSPARWSQDTQTPAAYKSCSARKERPVCTEKMRR